MSDSSSKLGKAIIKALQLERPRFRDRRGHYASDALKCSREQYWRLTGEPETDKSDAKGMLTLGIGTAIEHWLVSEVFRQLHFFGFHFIGTQVPVGGTNPVRWDGYLDGYLAIKTDDGKFKPFPLEVKTKHGFGADMIARTFEVSDDYMAQMGLYLKDLYEKKGLTYGAFLYVLLSDKNFGVVLLIHCEYLPETNEVRAYKGEIPSLGTVQELDQRFNMAIPFERWKRVEQAVKEKKCPPPDYFYKTPISSPEDLAKFSLSKLEKAAKGEAVLGDWQVLYSRYFKKILETDKLTREHTPEEIAVIKEEIGRRKTARNAKAKAARAAKKHTDEEEEE